MTEFDNPFFGYSDNPEAYAQSFRHIVNFLRRTLSEQSYLKTKFVWHSWAAPKSDGVSLKDFYPGDDYVDWVGISVFQQVFPWSSNWSNGYVNWGGDMTDIEEVLTFAKSHEKVWNVFFFWTFFIDKNWKKCKMFLILVLFLFSANNDCRINSIWGDQFE